MHPALGSPRDWREGVRQRMNPHAPFAQLGWEGHVLFPPPPFNHLRGTTPTLAKGKPRFAAGFQTHAHLNSWLTSAFPARLQVNCTCYFFFFLLISCCLTEYLITHLIDKSATRKQGGRRKCYSTLLFSCHTPLRSCVSKQTSRHECSNTTHISP